MPPLRTWPGSGPVWLFRVPFVGLHDAADPRAPPHHAVGNPTHAHAHAHAHTCLPVVSAAPVVDGRQHSKGHTGLPTEHPGLVRFGGGMCACTLPAGAAALRHGAMGGLPWKSRRPTTTTNTATPAVLRRRTQVNPAAARCALVAAVVANCSGPAARQPPPRPIILSITATVSCIFLHWPRSSQNPPCCSWPPRKTLVIPEHYHCLGLFDQFSIFLPVC